VSLAAGMDENSTGGGRGDHATLGVLTRGVVELHETADLNERLGRNQPLRVKAGFDPTRPDLHLGHMVLMRKLKDFQQLGHQIVLVIGDFTARIGDPSGRNTTRPVLSEAEINNAADTYEAQAGKILDLSKTQVLRNSEWLQKLNLNDQIRLMSQYTLARMLERDDFKKRFREHLPIALHELLYPLIQAYDSVVIQADVEFGGTDQLFNMLVGREIMRAYGQKPQIVMTTPLLEGLSARFENGKIVGDKMSKSLDNYVGFDEAPFEQVSKLMSVSDDLMWRYYELLSDRELGDIRQRRANCASGAYNPRDAKLDLAEEIATMFHGKESARAARNAWQQQFSMREKPQNMPLFRSQGEISLVDALAGSGTVESKTEARRRIQQGAVKVDGAKATDIHARLAPQSTPYEIKAGKHAWVRVQVE